MTMTPRGVYKMSMLAMLMMTTTALAKPVPAMPEIGVSSALIGRTESAKLITIALHLPSADQAGLETFIKHITTRGDAQFHKYLTPEQYAARFGAKQADYDAVIAWAQKAGLTVGEHYTGRTIVPLTGTVAQIEAALGTSFSDYRSTEGKTFYAASAAPRLPAEIAGAVKGVVGLSDRAHFASMAHRLPAGVKPLGLGNGPGGGFSGADLRSIYSVPKQEFGPKQGLAVFEQGGFDPKDVAKYLLANNLPDVDVRVRNVNGWDGSIDDPNVEAEAVLDIDMVIAMNPKAKAVRVYEQGSSPFSVALVNSLSAMAKDDAATSIGISYGTDESIQGSDAIDAENTVLEQMTAQGQTVFASSGDQGAYGHSGNGLNVEDPASQPFVTSVGGTTVFPAAKETYGVENVWNELFSGYGATGGGISSVWSIPGWQQPGGYSITVRNGGSTTMRNVPDVAAVGNPLTGVSIYSAENGGWLVIGGTSVSAPIWAGYYSLINAASEGLGLGTEGFANPAIYDIQTFRGVLYTTMNDVSDGNNGVPAAYGTPGFSAGPGYDNTTGWGSPIGSALLVDFIVPPSNGSNPPPAPTNLMTPSVGPASIKLSWTGAAGANGYAVLVTDESTASYSNTLITNKPAATLTKLKPGTEYYIEVYSISAQGSTLGNPIEVTTATK